MTETIVLSGADCRRKEIRMNEPITPEQAKRLLQAIFAEEDTDEDNYPETIADKVSYSEYVLTHNLQYIGKAIDRLSRLSRLFLVADKSGGLPDIITNNELRMALEPLLMVREDVNEITDYLLESYRETKPEDKKLEMREGERSCENCGNTRCANSAVAYNWDECVDSNFTKHWMPKKAVGE